MELNDWYVLSVYLSQAGEKHYHPTCARCARCEQMFGEGEEMYLQGNLNLIKSTCLILMLKSYSHKSYNTIKLFLHVIFKTKKLYNSVQVWSAWMKQMIKVVNILWPKSVCNVLEKNEENWLVVEISFDDLCQNAAINIFLCKVL